MLQLLCGRLNLCRPFDLRKLFLKESVNLLHQIIKCVVCGQNFCTSTKYKALCRDDYDIDTEVFQLSVYA